MRHNPLSPRLLLILVLCVALITSIVSAADPALHPNLTSGKNAILSAAPFNFPEFPLSGQLMFSNENFTHAWTLQTASAGWRARLFPTRVAAPDSSTALLSTGGTKETRTGGNRTDPFAVIDEKLVPSEAAGLKSLIQNTLHAFSYDTVTGAWYARNAANRITFTYTREGTAKFSEGENAFGLTLLGIGRGDRISPVGKSIVQADGRQLNITRPDYTEWYKNNDAGVEQGITLASRPAGSGLLHVGFGLTGDNSLSLKDTKTLILTDASGTPLFEYTGLHAFSSDGSDLPAALATDGTTLSWVVDDTGAVYPITIDPVVVSSSNATAGFKGGATGDCFGYSVALSSDGSTALVGAYYNATAGSKAGAAYIFEKGEGWSGTTSASAATARFTGGAVNDYFGSSVALSSDGSTALVGANDMDVAGAGAAYIFVKPDGGWSGTTSASAATARFTGGAENDHFGYSVALSSNGSTALVGAYQNSTGAGQAGAAYIFEKGEGWSSKSASDATAQFTNSPNADRFGYSVALSPDGSTALIGAYWNTTVGTEAGAAYIFVKPDGGWSSKSVSDATARFTAGGASDRFGYSVALSSTGSTALVGATMNGTADGRPGAAYIFEKGGGWSSKSVDAATAKFTGSQSSDRFGYSVALSSDGSTALVGATENTVFAGGAGAAYIFEKGDGWSSKSSDAVTYQFSGTLNEMLGNSVALSSTGSTALVGAKTANNLQPGAAYIFQPPFTTTLTAGGTTTGATGTTVDGLTINPTNGLTHVDLYLGTSASTVSGTAVKTDITSLYPLTATTVEEVNLNGKTVGSYYLILTKTGTTTILGATSSAVFTVTVAAPAVTSISPTSGTTAGGTSVVITGTGFTDATAVKFGSTNAASYTVNSATQITATSPAGAAGTVDITVTTAAGTSATGAADRFTYTTPAPTVTRINPASGTTAGGTDVTVTGTGFTDTTEVKFGSITADSFTEDSDTQITATSPAGAAGTVDITVTTAVGTSATSAADQFTYTATAAPTVTGIMPSSGQNTTTISITNLAGTGFYGSPTVNLTKAGQSNITATGVTVVSASKITCTFDLTSKVVGTWNVNVTNPDGQEGALVNGFTVTNSSAVPIADFTGTPLSGTAPLAVTFTDTSTGTPTSWNWFFGDGNSSTIQNPTLTYVTSGYFTVKLTAANAFGSNTKTASQYISVAAVSRQNSTENKNITQTSSGGQTNVNVSTCDPGMTVTNTTTQVLVTNPALGWQKYTYDGQNITKNACYVNISVSNVTMDSTPFTAALPDLGTVSTSLTIGQNQSTSGTLQQEIIPGANTTVTNAFQLAATNNGLTLGNIAYTLQISGAAPFNTNLTSSGVRINMSASHTWVLANGGTGAIRIFRYSDTGVVQVLPTTFVGTDAGSIDYFLATSVNGFSEFGLGGTSSTSSGSSGGGGGGGDSDGPVSRVTPQQVPITTKVNVGGDSAVTQVTITGTGISGAIVTGTVVSGPGLNTAPPTPMVYEYVDITPARYTTISEAVISFTVPVTWLTERQLTPPNVIMYHLVEKTWVALPTTLVNVENGVAYYTAASPGFSRFAITGQAGITSGTPLATLTPAGQTYGDLAPATATKNPAHATVAVRSETTQTTAIPAVSQPEPTLPLPTIAILGGVVVVLVAGGFLIRRWWIRRQNPALFRNYD